MMGVAIVTGGARGIGRGIALRLAADGLTSRSPTFPRCARRPTPSRTRCAPPGDVPPRSTSTSRDAEQVDAMIRRTVDDSAGWTSWSPTPGSPRSPRCWRSAPDDFDWLMAINLRGVFLCYTAAARTMIAQGDGGKIIGAASIAAHKGFSLLGHYSASKFARPRAHAGRRPGVGRARDHGQRLLPGDRRHDDVGAHRRALGDGWGSRKGSGAQAASPS